MNKIDYSKTNFNSIKGIPEVIARTIWRESRYFDSFYRGNTHIDLPNDITKINGVTVAHLVKVNMVSDYTGRGYEQEMWTNIKQPTFKFEVVPAIKVCRIDYPGLSKFRILVARDLLCIYPSNFVESIMAPEYNTLNDVYKALDEINAFIEHSTGDCCVCVRDITRYYLGAKIEFLVDDIFSTVEDAYIVGNEAILEEAKRSFDAYKKNRAEELRKVHSKYSKNLNTIRKKVDAITSAFSKVSSWKFEPPKPQQCPTSTSKKEEKVLGKLDITVTVTAEE